MRDIPAGSCLFAAVNKLYEYNVVDLPILEICKNGKIKAKNKNMS